MLEAISKRSLEVTAEESHATWIGTSFEGADESERETHKKETHALWIEICEALETEEGADSIEQCREEKMDIVADLSARERAEKRNRMKRSMGESGFLNDAVSDMELNSVSASDAMLKQNEQRAQAEADKLQKLDEWKQKEVKSS